MKATSVATRVWLKQRRRLLQRHFQELRVLAIYRLIPILQWPFGYVFWAIEQRKGRLADKLANEGTEL